MGRRYFKAFVYALLCPDTADVKYIGATVDHNLRYDMHLNSPKYSDLPLQRWISGLLAEGKKPVMSVLYRCDIADKDKYECIFHDHYKSLGCTLFNTRGFRYWHEKIDIAVLQKIVKRKKLRVMDIAEQLNINSSGIYLYLKTKTGLSIDKANELNSYLLSAAKQKRKQKTEAA